MTKMTTITTTLDAIRKALDVFGARFFSVPCVKIGIEIPTYFTTTLDCDALSAALKIRTVDGRSIAGTVAAFTRRAAAALMDQDADGLDDLIYKMDHEDGWTCVHYEDDAWNQRVDDPDDYVEECLIMTHLDSLVTFYVYLQGAGDLLYSPHRKGV